MSEQHMGSRWPERDAVHQWIMDCSLGVTFDQAIALKNAVSVYRIEKEKEIKSLAAEVERLRDALEGISVAAHSVDFPQATEKSISDDCADIADKALMDNKQAEDG